MSPASCAPRWTRSGSRWRSGQRVCAIWSGGQRLCGGRRVSRWNGATPGAGGVESTPCIDTAAAAWIRVVDQGGGSGWWIRVVDQGGGSGGWRRGNDRAEPHRRSWVGCRPGPHRRSGVGCRPGPHRDPAPARRAPRRDRRIRRLARLNARGHPARAHAAFAFPMQIGSATFGAMICTAVTRVVRAAPHRPRNDSGHLRPQACLATRFMGY